MIGTTHEQTTRPGHSEPGRPSMRIGHIHLKVSDLARSINFYQEVLGFDLQQTYGNDAAFLSVDGYHHHIALNTWQSRGGTPPPASATGLFHAAILYPDFRALALAVKRVEAANVPIDGASDHGVSIAFYLRDPDDNGLELYADRAVEAWPRATDGKLAMFTQPLDRAAFMSRHGAS